MDSTFISQSKHGIMDEEEQELKDNSSSSCSSSLSSSSSQEYTEDTASSSGSSCKGPLSEMASLKQQLPFKRGLSKYYEGKSQSFTSFSDIRCFEDLAKPERPLKKLKSSKSYGGDLDIHRSSLSLKCCNIKRGITKKSSSSSSSSLFGRRSCLLSINNKPPLYPQRPSNMGNNQNLLWFA